MQQRKQSDIVYGIFSYIFGACSTKIEFRELPEYLVDPRCNGSEIFSLLILLLQHKREREKWKSQWITKVY